uniref:ATP synthase F0 subunit 8 n=1 Tax=Hyphydrus ovatus TaxID=159814 RepID=UPI002027D74A|nr:ATP synthase F0 subunit 8 [Hyphydrus ovatus]UPL65087.1 ATP synthase F0 subunit 8 [Hyphydrus ovatus]
MPQMAPMNWIMLYFLFSMIFILFNFLNFYMFLMLKKSKNFNNICTKNLNWKW